MAFELLAYILVAVFLGGWLDEKFEFEKPWLTIVLMFLFLAAWFVRLIKDTKG